MSKTIQQKVVFRSTTCETLYHLYVNARMHSVLTGGKAKISEKEATKFSAYGGYCSGKNLQLIPGKLIVQSWRATDWNDNEVDSTFILLFEQKGKNAEVFMTHANVPDSQVKALAEGWNEFYWIPWRNYLAGK
jgi:activator of HSP90 ATPase